MVDLGVQRDDLRGYLPQFINRGMTELQKLRDWTFCHTLGQVTIPDQNGQVAMPSDFKSMGDTPSAMLISTTGIKNPCKLFHRAQFFAMQARNILSVPFVPPLYNCTINFPLWWGIIDGIPMIGLPSGVPAQGPLTFEISYYRYLPKLQADSDVNQFTLHHTDALIDMAKYIAFKSVNDPAKTDALNDAMTAFKVAAAKDDHIRLAGISLRMGG